MLRCRCRQRCMGGEGVQRDHVRVVFRLDPGQRRQRQPVADRRVAGREEQAAAPGLPALAAPAAAVARLPALDRQRVARGHVEAAVEHPGQPLPLHRVVELVVDRVEIGREHVLLEHEIGRVLVGRHGVVGLEPEPLGQAQHEPLDMGHGGAARRLLVGDQGRVAPQRQAVAAPVERERPARQLLARVPFALPVMDQAARCEPRLQPLDQVVGPAALESGPPPRCSTPRLRGRRSRRRSARRRPSAGRRP